MPDLIPRVEGGDSEPLRPTEDAEQDTYEPTLTDKFQLLFKDLLLFIDSKDIVDGEWHELPLDFQFKYKSVSLKLDGGLAQIGAITPTGNEFVWHIEDDELKVTTFPKDGGVLQRRAYTRTLSERDFDTNLAVPIAGFQVREVARDPAVEVLEGEILDINQRLEEFSPEE